MRIRYSLTGLFAVALWLFGEYGAAISQEAPSRPEVDSVSQAMGVESANEISPDETMTVEKIIKMGGKPMYVLAAMSVMGLAMVLYFLLMLRENQIVPRRFQNELRLALTSGELDKARDMCMKDRSAIASVTLSAIEYAHNAELTDLGLLKDIIEGEGSRQASMIQNQIQYLQDIAVIAPMVGLLGTVLGMLTAFNAVALKIAEAKPVVLAAGVSQALITTAAGLIVGIPAMMAYAYFRGRSAKLISILENVSAEVLTLLVRKRRP